MQEHRRRQCAYELEGAEGLHAASQHPWPDRLKGYPAIVTTSGAEGSSKAGNLQQLCSLADIVV